MAALDIIASELLKSANEADLNYKKTRDQAQRDKAVRLRKIVENLRLLTFGASDLNGLSDVTISAATNGQVLAYNSTSGQWVNQNPTAGTTPTLAQVTTAGNTTTNAITVGNATVNGPVNSVFAHTPTTNYTGFGGVQLNAADGTERGFFKLSPGTGEVKIGAVGSGYFTTLHTAGLERMRIFFSSGNVAINSTTDAGYKLDVNGTARVSDTATIAKALNITGTVAVTGTGTTYANTFSSNINGTFTGATIATLLVNEAGFSGTGSGIQNYAIVAGSSVFSKLTVNSQSTFTDSTAAQMRLQGYNVLTGASGNASGTLLLTQTTSGGFLGLAATYGGGGSRISIFNQYNDGVTNSTSQVKVNIAGTDIAIFAGSGELAIGKGAALSGASLTTSTSITAASAIARGVYFNNTLVAAANNDVLVGLDINPTFTNGAFTGLTGYGLRVKASLNTVNQTDYVASFENTHPLYGNGIQIIGAGDKGGARLLLRAANNDGTNVFRILGNGSISVGAGNNSNAGTIVNNAAISLGGYQTISHVDSTGIVFSPFSSANAVTFRQGGNVLIGTTTDAGYKIQVQGVGYFNTNTASTSSVLRLTDANTGTAWVGFSSSTTTGFFIGSNGGMTLGHVTADNSNPSTAHARISINQLGNPGLSLSTNSANVGIIFSDGVNATIRMNFPSTGEAAITTISAHNLSIGVAASTGSLSSTTMKFFQSTGNVAINTTTDAGYKLDVNGTARITGTLTVGQIINGNGTSNLIMQTHVAASSVLTIQYNGPNNATSGNKAIATLISTFNPTSGAATHSALDITHTINQTGTASGISRGIYINPTLTSVVDYRAIETTAGKVVFNGGNVGIGTTTPTELLHIVNNTNGNKFGRISAGAADASAAWVAQNDQVDNIVYRVFGSGVAGSQMGVALARSASLIANLGGTGKFLIGTYSATDLVFGTNDQERMRLVNNTGNFLIGTLTDVGTKLNVSGDVNALGYRVNNVVGYTGILNIPGNPPGQQNVDIQGGIIINIF